MDHASPQKEVALDTRLACLLSFDVECWDEGDWLAPYLGSAAIPDPESDRRIVEELLRLLKDAQATATLFVTTRYLERYPDVIRCAHEQGHEIGTHGPRHLRLQQQTPEQLRTDLEYHHRLLANICAAQPLGYRAPHFSLEKKTTWILPLLREFGYHYDSSLFAANSLEYGSAETPNSTHSIATPAGIMKEVPVPGFPCFGRRFPFAGGIYFRLLPSAVFTWLVKRFARHQTPVLYFHPHELSALTPRIQQGPVIKRFFKYFGTRRALAKFRSLTAQFRFASIRSTLS